MVTWRLTCRARACTPHWSRPLLQAWTSRCSQCLVRDCLWLSAVTMDTEVIIRLHGNLNL